MSKFIEYTYVKDVAIITDENGDMTLSPYYDNLDEVLVHNNLIEAITNRISELEQKMISYQQKHRFPFRYTLSTAGITGTVSLSALYSHGINSLPILTPFGAVSATIYLPTLIGIGIGLFSAVPALSKHFGNIVSTMDQNGIQAELEFLRKKLVSEKQLLDHLQSSRIQEKEKTDFSVTTVNDKPQLYALESDASLYYELGCNGKKYYQDYQHGRLDQSLQDYSTSQIQTAKEYLEEKGPTLVKRYHNGVRRK